MLLKIVIGSAGDAPELLFTVRELKHQVGCGLGVEGQFFLRVDVFGDTCTRQTYRNKPVGAGICLLYSSDSSDDMNCVDLAGRRIIK